MKRIRIFFVVSLFMNLIAALLIGMVIHKLGGFSYLTWKVGLNPTFQNQNLPHIPYHYQRVSLFNKLKINKDDIIFIGNSITDGCEWSELFNNPHIKNRGIGSDVTSGVLERVDDYTKYNPKKIFIMIGFNDLSKRITIGTLLRNYKQIVSKIKTSSPVTKIYIQSILPINSKFYKGSATNDSIKFVNGELENMARDNQIIYIDLFSHFVNSEGMMNEIFSNDGIHLMGDGYLVWQSLILEHIQ